MGGELRNLTRQPACPYVLLNPASNATSCRSSANPALEVYRIIRSGDL